MLQDEENKNNNDKLWEEICKIRCQKCMHEIEPENILNHHYLLDGDVASEPIGYCCTKCKIVVRDDMNSVFDLEKGFSYNKDTYTFEAKEVEENRKKNLC